MLVDCSEISVSVIVKRVQHVAIIKAFCPPGGTYLSFSLPRRKEKIVG